MKINLENKKGNEKVNASQVDLSDPLANKMIEVLEAIETKLQKAYEKVEMDELCELERQMGMKYKMVIDLLTEDDESFLLVEIIPFYACKQNSSFTVEQSLDCEMPEIDRSERKQEKQVVPVLKNWMEQILNDTNTERFYASMANDVTLRFNDGDNGWFNVKTQDSKREKTWLAYVEHTIQEEQYHMWKDMLKVVNQHLKKCKDASVKRLFLETFSLPIRLLGKVETVKCTEYFTFVGRRLDAYGALYATAVVDDFFETLTHQESFTPTDQALINLLDEDAYFMSTCNYANQISLLGQQLKPENKELKVARTLEDLLDALELGLLALEKQWEKIPFEPSLFAPTVLKGSANIILRDKGAKAKAEIELWTGVRIGGSHTRIPVQVPYTFYALFGDEYHENFEKDVWEQEETQQKVQKLIEKRMEVTDGKNIYAPVNEIEVTIMPISQCYHKYLKPCYAPQFNRYKQEFKQYLEAQTYQEDFPLKSLSGELVVLFAALMECDKAIVTDFLKVMKSTLKSQEVNFKKYNVFASAMLSLFSRIRLGQIPFEYTEHNLEMLMELANYFLKNGAKNQHGYVNDLLHMLSDKGQETAKEAVVNHEAWFDETYWYRYDPAGLIDVVTQNKQYSELFTATKKSNIAIVLKEESEQAYAQALDYLLEQAPIATGRVKETHTPKTDNHFHIAVKFVEKPLFPKVRVYGAQGTDGSIQGYSLGFMGNPELALFTKAATWESLHEKIRQYISLMLEHKWRTNEGSELDTLLASSALAALVLSSSDHLDLIEPYCAHCDDEHEDVQLNLIPAIKNTYGLNEKTIKVITKLASSFQTGWDYLEEDQEIMDYIDANEN